VILHQSQKIIAKDLHRFRVVNCGRRFGKSILAVEEMIGVAISADNKRVIYYAPTRDDARDIVWNILVKRCEPITTYKNDSRLELKVRTQKGGESLITLYGWESVQERGKGRGLSNDFIVFDEVAQYRNFWVGWEEVLSPTLIDNKGSAMFISTPQGFNHFYDLYNLESGNKDFKSFHFTTYDNPFIPVEEIEREKASKTSDRFAQEFMADFRKATGLVYKEFDREKHLFDNLNTKVIDKLLGIDFGYVHPAGILTVYKDDKGHYWIDDEWYKTQKTDAEIAEFAASIGCNKAYPDPENQGAIKELENRKVNVQEVIKGKGSVENGIQRIRDLFKQGRLHINRKCVNLLYELETYHYENDSEVPVKEDDHLLDALRYVILMNDYRQIQTKTREEIMVSREILKQFDSRKKRPVSYLR
jgi:PBSX family phage terminase large subunit